MARRSFFVSVLCALALPVSVARAQVVRQSTDVKVDTIGPGLAAIDDAGTTIFAASSANVAGVNPDHAIQLVKWSMPGGAGSQVTALSGGTAFDVSVTDDGQTLLFASPEDPFGTNPDHGLELFLIQADGGGLTQLTSTPAAGGEVGAGRISGSGNRVVFLSSSDPLGTNPALATQLFVVDTDGQNMVQLTDVAAGSSFEGSSISDDGTRIVFSTDGDPAGGGGVAADHQVFAILNDGSGLSQLTALVAAGALAPVISGNGLRVAYWTSDLEIQVVPWAGGAALVLGSGYDPSISDDGQWIYFADPSGEIFSARANGFPLTRLTVSAPGLINWLPVVSGSNSRVVFRVSGGAHPGGDNPDAGFELMAMDANGSNLTQISLNQTVFEAIEPDVTPDGSRIVFSASGNPDGTGSALGTDVFYADRGGSGPTRVTSLGYALHPTITADGATIAFMSIADPLGQNSCETLHVFAVQADGGGLIQLTPDSCAISDHPVLSADGSVVVFQSTGNFAGTNGDGGSELFAVPAGGGAITQVVDDDDSLRKNPQISDDGQWVAYHSSSNFDGANPDGSVEIFRARTDGTLVQRITADPLYSSGRPDVSADGTRIAYTSSADPLGTNADHNGEVFLHDATTALTSQLTFTTDGQAATPRISGDGSTIYFFHDGTFFDSPPRKKDLYRVDVAGGTIARAGGLIDPRDVAPIPSLRQRPGVAVDHAGVAAYAPLANAAGTNLDFNREVYLIDFDALGTIEADRGVPARVRWDAAPGPVRYDLIRGDVADLRPDGGGEVDLGSVACLDDDSADNQAEDPVQPLPGQTFFYLLRGSQGNLDGPGSWGEGSGGATRIPGAGGCAD